MEVLDEYDGHTILRVKSHTVDKHEDIDFVVLQAYVLSAQSRCDLRSTSRRMARGSGGLAP